MQNEGRKRVVIENVWPEIDGGQFPIKRVVGEKVIVRADIFTDGHDSVSARLLYRKAKDKSWQEVPMQFVENDRWEGEFPVEEIGIYHYTLQGWVDHFKTWQKDIKKKFDVGQDIEVDLLIGVEYIEAAAKRASGNDEKRLLEVTEILKKGKDLEKSVESALHERLTALMEKYSDKRFATLYIRELAVVVDRIKARFSRWYERFPRSCSSEPGKHGTFKDCEKILSEVVRMGFDILYLPPLRERAS